MRRERDDTFLVLFQPPKPGREGRRAEEGLGGGGQSQYRHRILARDIKTGVGLLTIIEPSLLASRVSAVAHTTPLLRGGTI